MRETTETPSGYATTSPPGRTLIVVDRPAHAIASAANVSTQYFISVDAHSFAGFRRSDHRNHFKVREILPVRHPLVEQRSVIALHHLVTDLEIVGDPAADVFQPRRRKSSFVPKALIDRSCITVVESLDDHIQHCRTITGRDASSGV